MISHLSTISPSTLLLIWAAATAASVAFVSRDVLTRNRQLGDLMKWVWVLTALYAGPFGALAYAVSGRKEIASDSLWRRGLRSTAHCFAGCGLGEVLGIALGVGLLALSNLATTAMTFTFAYLIGLGFTVGPLMADGVPWRRAVGDGVISETASIVTMEATAIAVGLGLAAGATMAEPRFWLGLATSLVTGYVAATPVNMLLIRLGIKEGMHDPRAMASAA